MIPLLSGWTWAYRDDAYVMQSQRGTLLYRERCRPLRSLRSILDEVSSALGAPERLQTLEGELAAVASDPSGELSAGIVIGDDFYSLLVGRGPLASIVRQLVEQDVHSLGVRRRRFWFEPPAWPGVAMLFHAVYLAPGFPRRHGMLSVMPALPRPVGEVNAEWMFAIHDLPMMKFSRDTALGTATISSAAGVNGRIQELRGSAAMAKTIRFLAVLEDATYLYPLTLDTTDEHRDEDLAVFHDVIRSIVPLPARTQPTSGASALAYFSD
jgi:hypothetical protein